MPYIYFWNRNCNLVTWIVHVSSYPAKVNYAGNKRFLFIFLPDNRITRIIMNVSFLWHSLHYLQVAKRLYCAKHYTRSQTLHTTNIQQVCFAHRDSCFSRVLSQRKPGKSGGEKDRQTVTVWKKKKEGGRERIKKKINKIKKEFQPQMSQHTGRHNGWQSVLLLR